MRDTWGQAHMTRGSCRTSLAGASVAAGVYPECAKVFRGWGVHLMPYQQHYNAFRQCYWATLCLTRSNMALTKAGTALRWAILTSQAGSASPGALVTTYGTS